MIGFEYDGAKYYYGKNVQGDIVKIYNASGIEVVSYKYDAWGKVLSVTGSEASGIGALNPFRYRSYYYDTETGFYYLQSRYYDPEVGRFLNADGILGANGGIYGYNMFAYCNNNPVMYSDPSGAVAGFMDDQMSWESLSGGAGAGDSLLRAVGYALSVAAILYIASQPPASTTTIPYEPAIPQWKIEAFKKAKAEAREKAEAKEEVIPNNPPISNGETYYHVTTMENALLIMSSGKLLGSSSEGGHVFAFKIRPSKKAVEASGAHFGVIISFQTTAPFQRDNGIVDPKVLKYMPVVSVFSGLIIVTNVKIVG